MGTSCRRKFVKTSCNRMLCALSNLIRLAVRVWLLAWTAIQVLGFCLVAAAHGESDPTHRSDRILGVIQTSDAYVQAIELGKIINERHSREEVGVAHLVRALRNEDTSSQQFGEDVTSALKHGVANAALLYAAQTVGKASTNLEEDELAFSALRRLSYSQGFVVPFSMELILRRRSQLKDVPSLYVDYAAGTFGSGSPVVVGRLLFLSQTESGKRTLCHLLKTSAPKLKPRKCFGLEDSKGSTSEAIEKSRSAYTSIARNALGRSYQETRTIACSSVGSAVESSALCDDILSSVVAFCIIKIEATPTSVLDGMNICREEEFRTVASFVVESASKLLELDIGNQ